jgi:hypothetical protein
MPTADHHAGVVIPSERGGPCGAGAGRPVEHAQAFAARHAINRKCYQQKILYGPISPNLNR